MELENIPDVMYMNFNDYNLTESLLLLILICLIVILAFKTIDMFK